MVKFKFILVGAKKFSPLLYTMLVFLLSSCGSNEKPIEKEKEVKQEQSMVDPISLTILDDNQSLKDSIAFYELVGKILLNREHFGGKEGPREFISDEIYQMVYQTPDSIVPLSRKMDLIQILIYFYHRTTDYYVNSISHRIRDNSDDVRNKPFLLLPFIYTNLKNEVSPSIVKCVLEQDSIQVPKEYLEYSREVNNYLSTLPKNDLKEALKKIKTDHISGHPNSKKFFTKTFQKRYHQIPDWRII